MEFPSEAYAGGGGHFNDGGFAVVDKPQEAVGFIEIRVINPAMNNFALTSFDKSLHGALSAVGDGNGKRLTMGKVIGNGLCHDIANKGGGHGAFERIGNESHFFHIILLIKISIKQSRRFVHSSQNKKWLLLPMTHIHKYIKKFIKRWKQWK